jgi:RimJ/RimL family protein N-acetyltransferase
MPSPTHYNILGKDPFCNDEYSISSIMMEDAEPIRIWRNEQISALRQNQPLTKVDQVKYFRQIIENDFGMNRPNQILVRFCHEEKLIGYGGLVHIDWTNLRAEISFLLKTTYTHDQDNYCYLLSVFFDLIKKLAFEKLGLHKLTTEAYAHRGYHVSAIENTGFKREGILREHTIIEGKWTDAIMASCLCSDYFDQQKK